MFYVYILKSKKNNKLYIGFTRNLRRRLIEHNKELNVSTKGRGPLELIYYEAYKSKKDALKREQILKKFKTSYRKIKRRIENSLK